MMTQLSNTAALDPPFAAQLSAKRLLMTPLLVRVLALVAVMILAHLG